MNPRLAFVAAPLLTAAYGVIRILDGLDGSRGPGLAWTSGHLAFVAALVLFVPVFWEMRRLAGRGPVAATSVAIGLAGALALIAQFGIDIVVGFQAADHDAMGPLFDRVRSVPGVPFVVYDAVPVLFYVGQLALIVRLAALRTVKVWVPLVFALGIVLPLVDKDLIPLGAVFMLVSFVPLIGRVSRTASPVPA
ncbi:hypothetical protein [Microtetraspora niveoalba]|uniref:hypothetical protein n=1 Tax=Microtetraspora niveoalba TaxID=46175 RepID=UPI00082A3699|nr:hypothetical protein [Microtetraspora niveoalba]